MDGPRLEALTKRALVQGQFRGRGCGRRIRRRRSCSTLRVGVPPLTWGGRDARIFIRSLKALAASHHETHSGLLFLFREVHGT